MIRARPESWGWDASSREAHRRVNHQPLIHAGNRPLHS
jgi:hypothetical protein